ncbi:MAG: hypothetical protein B7Y88_03090 [Sphingomonadales bacterium 32-64-17]|nr:MAG: hypothetical protein B7Y88_03090 [Sphingomonadales bacterium 32-64-17]
MTTRTLLPASLAQRPHKRLVIGLVAAFAVALAAALMAQVSGDRGIPPVASSTDIEVRGIEVNVGGDNPEDARSNGWLEATRKAWEKINGPELPDARLESLVSAIVVEEEDIGPRRYIARLGVIFDRQRAGPLLGGGGDRARSAPMLLMPVMMSGGTATTFEMRNQWQRAWAEYQFGSSAIDYVRPVGSGSDSLLLTYGQTGRRSRAWWNNLLDQFGAADVLVPIAKLRHEWPGGPVVGTFTARYGPDDRYLGEFTMRAENDEQLPRMLVRAVEQFNTIYTRALAAGALRPDPTLELDGFEMTPEIRALLEEARAAQAAEAAAEAAAAARALAEGAAAAVDAPVTQPGQPSASTPTSYTVQIATPDASSFDAALGAVRGTPGVSASAVTSTAIGGTSVLRVTFAGSLSDFAAALRARGWQVTEGTGALSITR